MIKVDLGIVGEVSLIIPFNTGVFYQVQVGNHACIQRLEEGFLVPIEPLVLPDEPNSIMFRLSSMDWLPILGIDTDKADEIDAVLHSLPYGRALSVDRDRLGESEEAWIYVNIDLEGLLIVQSDQMIHKGILVWANTD